VSEGLLARCPTCDKLIAVDPSRLTGEALCPRCRVRIWFVVVEGKARLYLHDRVSPSKKQFIAALTASPDSLDMVELVMELEKELGTAFNMKKLSEFHSLGDLIDYIIGELPD
jgi:acyl carrier protein